MITIKGNIVWNEYNSEHIKKHKVGVEEVEFLLTHDFLILPAYLNRKMAVSRVNKRILSVVFVEENKGILAITARDASKKERRIFYEYEKNKANTEI